MDETLVVVTSDTARRCMTIFYFDHHGIYVTLRSL